jgi:2-isopropylmalate synthase
MKVTSNGNGNGNVNGHGSANGKTAAERVVVFDTTLRDGEQSPGASMRHDDKLEIARALRDLGVDVIEAGFPMASAGIFEAVRAIARSIEGPTICALARCQREDVDRAWDAVRDALSSRLHVFIATSPLHREHKLGMTREQVLSAAVKGVALARESTEDVEFSAEDASRTEPEFLVEVFERAIEAGATTVNVPDTVGYSMPHEISSLVMRLRREVRGIEHVVVSAHCHDDLGVAVANTLAAIEGGARQVECTINGLGERAGNCSLEEVVMALATRYPHFRTAIETRLLCSTSQLVSRITGFAVPPNKAIVGRNAFAHESGIHQHGVLAHRETYEVMRAEDVGFGGSQLVLGKHSGRHALKRRLELLGYCLADEERLDAAFVSLKRMADHKTEIDDDDLRSIFEGRVEHWGP